MTGIVEQQPRDAAIGPTSELGRVSHWIGGRIVEGASGRRGPVYDPAIGRQQKWVDFASAARAFPARVFEPWA